MFELFAQLEVIWYVPTVKNEDDTDASEYEELFEYDALIAVLECDELTDVFEYEELSEYDEYDVDVELLE